MNRINLSIMMFLMMSCSKVESLQDSAYDLNPESPLEISVFTTQTKGAIVESPQDMGSVGLYCAMTGSDKWSDSTEFTKLDDRRFNISTDGDWVIEGSPEPWGYESLSDMYTIYAYSPHSGDDRGVSPRIENGELFIEYVVPNSSVDQPDLMFAQPRKDIYPQIADGVSLTFYHALSCISFSVISTIDVKITSIDIEGVIFKGTCQWDYNDDSIKWSLGDAADTTSFSVEIDDYTLDDNSSAQVNTEQGYLMMIPQELSNGAKVTVTLETGEQRNLMIPAGSEWTIGSKYRYIINLDDDSIISFNSTQISNCYIINPTIGEETVIQIPIQQRINDFWRNYSSYGSRKITSSSSTDEFYVKMVWEDFDDDFSFSYELLFDSEEKMAVKLYIPAEYQEGNFVFEVQDSKGYTLWSWHLWFTDYNPDAIAAQNIDKIQEDSVMTYTLSGYNGAVHRYNDIDIENVTAKNVDSVRVWSNMYKDKFIMDRNIGERNNYAANYGAGSVYYQFGRKDPYPGLGAIYVDGDITPGTRSSSGFSFDASVEFVEDYFVSNSSSSDNWCGETASRNASCIWFDADIPSLGYTEGKSIFDPSPLGWRVPVICTWNNFNSTTSNIFTSTYYFYGCYNSTKSGYLDQSQVASYVWSANPINYDSGYNFYYSSSGINNNNELTFTYGLPIRAIQE
ncbi:MAG: fimbrillin family protein [Rikenellaceae bacterium]